MQGSASFRNLSIGAHILYTGFSQVYRWDLFKAQDSTAKRVQKSETFRNYTEYRKLMKLLNMVVLEAK